jgi:hypothetical protein
MNMTASPTQIPPTATDTNESTVVSKSSPQEIRLLDQMRLIKRAYRSARLVSMDRLDALQPALLVGEKCGGKASHSPRRM